MTSEYMIKLLKKRINEMVQNLRDYETALTIIERIIDEDEIECDKCMGEWFDE